jgi:uncharacterized protein YndB with AHSA1/START domain
MIAPNPSNEINITRIYDAPVKAVWDAWVDPAQAAQWWGPRGFTTTTHSKDFRPGGHWTYTMHGPDGVDYPNTTLYLEIVEHSKLVYDHGAHQDRPPVFRVTVLFTSVDGKTKMDMCMTLPTPEAAAETHKFVKKVGGYSTWDRLAEYLDKQLSGKEDFFINQSFNAPIELMFEMWTNPDHFSQWLPPTGFQMEFLRAEIKSGGSALYLMTGGNGVKMYGRVEYLKIQRPDLIVYTQQFCDEKENVSRHPVSPTWPATMLTVVKLTSEGPKQTRVTVIWEPHGPTTKEELETFIQARAGMTQGWTGSFDKLEAYINNQNQ